MSLDPILRLLHLDFPQLTKSTFKRLDQCSWWGQIVVPAAAGAYAVSQKEYSDIWLLARALIVNQAFIDISKKILVARRPNGHKESFPSGHTAAVFVAPVYLVLKYGWKRAKVATLLTLTAAVAVAASRVLLKAHWVHDVVAGAVLGASVIYLSMKYEEKLSASAGISSLIVLAIKLRKKTGKAVSRILS
jgi:membrane-associated phospholipid phosphatase